MVEVAGDDLQGKEDEHRQPVEHVMDCGSSKGSVGVSGRLCLLPSMIFYIRKCSYVNYGMRGWHKQRRGRGSHFYHA